MTDVVVMNTTANAIIRLRLEPATFRSWMTDERFAVDLLKEGSLTQNRQMRNATSTMAPAKANVSRGPTTWLTMPPISGPIIEAAALDVEMTPSAYPMCFSG